VIRFTMLGSGSKGNGTLVECGPTRVLVDCGFFLKEAEARMQRVGVEPGSLSAILVTHEHNDHLGGVARFARKHHVPVWMTHGTFAAWDDPVVPRVHRFAPHEPFAIGELTVQPFPVPHDAREPCHYVFGDGTRRVGILSDAGHVTAHMRTTLSGLDALLLEFNHDLHMLAVGPYTPSLKARVGGVVGHLSNLQAAALLAALDRSRLQHLVLTHLSEVNNTPALARAAAIEAAGVDAPWIECAHQYHGIGWREVV
jgi:phosphoribosyl 1,2-cyclic phosphodiesterase